MSWTTNSKYNYMQQNTLDFELISKAVTDVTGIERVILLGKKRDEPFSDARKILAFELKRFYKAGVKRIGEYMNKDHSTIVTMQQRFHDLYSSDIIFKKKADAVRQIINNF